MQDREMTVDVLFNRLRSPFHSFLSIYVPPTLLSARFEYMHNIHLLEFLPLALLLTPAHVSTTFPHPIILTHQTIFATFTTSTITCDATFLLSYISQHLPFPISTIPLSYTSGNPSPLSIFSVMS